jgi:predicted TIM-barrel fold metal-dependent hydrolase
VLPGGRVPQMLRQYPNLCADLSAGSGLNALARDPAFGCSFLIEFQDKLLFGRDYFDTRLMDFLKEQQLPREVFDKIACQNAQRLLTTYLA